MLYIQYYLLVNLLDIFLYFNIISSLMSQFHFFVLILKLTWHLGNQYRFFMTLCRFRTF